MNAYFLDDGSAVSGADLLAMVRENIAHLAPDDPAYAEQVELLKELTDDITQNSAQRAAQNSTQKMTGGDFMKVYRYRYYCKHRPPMPGAIPRAGLVRISGFNYKQCLAGVGAWGWAEYSRPLSDEEIAQYELAPSRNNPLNYSE